jgi:hypothetical protein
MTEIVAPKPEFLSLTDAAVLAALGDPDPANPIAVEINRLVTAYTKNFRDHVERLGYIPADILRIKPRTTRRSKREVTMKCSSVGAIFQRGR